MSYNENFLISWKQYDNLVMMMMMMIIKQVRPVRYIFLHMNPCLKRPKLYFDIIAFSQFWYCTSWVQWNMGIMYLWCLQRQINFYRLPFQKKESILFSLSFPTFPVFMFQSILRIISPILRNDGSKNSFSLIECHRL